MLGLFFSFSHTCSWSLKCWVRCGVDIYLVLPLKCQKTGHTALASPLSRTNIAQVVSCVCCLKKVKRVNTLTFAVDKKNGCFFICVLYVYGLPCFRVRARRRFSICLRPTLFGVLFFGRKEEPFCFLYILSCAACGGTGGGCRWRALWFLLVFWGEVVFVAKVKWFGDFLPLMLMLQR